MSNLRTLLGEVSGAFADLGTFLPIVLGVLSLRQIDPTGLLVGFGLFALAVALIYRRPIPVQPMKVVAAIAIAGQLDPAVIAATGLLLGVVLILLGLSGWIDQLAEKLPQTVLQGIQLGIGLSLVWSGIKLMADQWLFGAALLFLLLLLQQTRGKTYALPMAVVILVGWSLIRAPVFPALDVALYLPPIVAFHWDDLWRSATGVLFPQLALTLTNAILVTAAIAGDLFPEERARITPRRLALSSGGLNLLLAPFGAFPMCHGAGGLVVQHRFGARTGLAPAIFGLSCLSLGLFLGPDALKLLELLPISAVGALLAVAGIHLALSKKLQQTKPRRLTVVVVTAAGCLLFNVAIGLVVGLLSEFVRRRYIETAEEDGCDM
ncbi:MAG: putative sulfate/molybdate transporter [Candidatus Thiodiazotropha sp.]